MLACVPYDRGDLVARVHRVGDVLASSHTPFGTQLHVRIDPELAAELAQYEITQSDWVDVPR
jgi:GTP-binding protein HflX